jgi:hypothetical protein
MPVPCSHTWTNGGCALDRQRVLRSVICQARHHLLRPSPWFHSSRAPCTLHPCGLSREATLVLLQQGLREASLATVPGASTTPARSGLGERASMDGHISAMLCTMDVTMDGRASMDVFLPCSLHGCDHSVVVWQVMRCADYLWVQHCSVCGGICSVSKSGDKAVLSGMQPGQHPSIMMLRAHSVLDVSPSNT